MPEDREPRGMRYRRPHPIATDADPRSIPELSYFAVKNSPPRRTQGTRRITLVRLNLRVLSVPTDPAFLERAWSAIAAAAATANLAVVLGTERVDNDALLIIP